MRSSSTVKRILSILFAVVVTLVLNSALAIAVRVGGDDGSNQKPVGITTGPGSPIPTNIPKPLGVMRNSSSTFSPTDQKPI